MKNSEQKNSAQLWKELLDITSKQLEINTQLKEIIEASVGALSKRRRVVLTEEMFNKAQDLFVEGESLQAEVRALFHKLFGTEE